MAAAANDTCQANRARYGRCYADDDLSAMDFTKRGVMRTAVRICAMRSFAAG
jgi:hypothetical protein